MIETLDLSVKIMVKLIVSGYLISSYNGLYESPIPVQKVIGFFKDVNEAEKAYEDFSVPEAWVRIKKILIPVNL